MIDVIELLFDERPNFLTADALALRYGVGKATIRNWVVRGVLPEPSGVRAATREMLWDGTLLPEPEGVQRPKRGGARHAYRRPAAPYQGPLEPRERTVG